MEAIKVVLYALAALSCLLCTVLLFRRWAQTRARLLLWSSLCFLGLSLNNILLFVDLVLLPKIDLRLARQVPALAGMLCLLYGFIWEADT